MEKKKIIKKILKIAGNVLFYLFLAICVFAVVVSVASKKDNDGAATIFGYQMRFVQSDSMGASPETDVSGYDIGSIPVKSMVFVQTVPEDPTEAEAWYADLEVGDVLTFRYVYVTQETITHRITNITPKKTGGYIITLEGDNKAGGDANTMEQVIDTSDINSPNYVVGKVTATSYLLGLLIYIIKQPVGIVCLIIIPCAIIIIFEVIRIVSAIGSDKREKDKKEKEQAVSELEALKQQLAALQNAVGAQQAGQVPPTEEMSTVEPAKDTAETASESAKAPVEAPDNDESATEANRAETGSTDNG